MHQTDALIAASPFACAFALAVVLLGGVAIAARVRALRRDREVRRRHARNVDAFRVARRDAVTGLQTRQAFVESLARRRAAPDPFCLLLVDIDGFAALNDLHGQSAGDEVLRALAARLLLVAAESQCAGRLGDDEFALLVEAGRGPHAAESTALSVRRALAEPVAAGIHVLELKASIGVAIAPSHGHDAESLLRAAQSALHEAKAAGGDGWRIFDLAQGSQQRLRASLKNELLEAAEIGEFIPYYQPIVELATGEVVGLEVLARWDNPRRGLLMPELFIPLAEEMQLAGAISQCLLRRVVRDARDWPAWFYFAFNASPSQLRELVGLVHAPPCWPEGTLDPRRIEIEVTESALIQDMAVAREVMGALQARGTRVVLDDFGTGFSNFTQLRELPFDRIKIDRSFVMDMATHERADACVRAMIGLGHSLSIEMVAEGVETVETAATLAALGCRFGQGFLYARPVPASGVPSLLRYAAPTMAAAVA